MKKKIKKYKILIPWILLVLSCFVIFCLWFQLSYKNNSDNKQEEILKITQEVGKLIVLPDEVPTILTVTDLEKLKGQIFFENAKVGDKVLIYTKAQKAILYDPIMNKIVELTSLNIKNNQEIKP